jgi:hypothetical protein
MYAHSNSYEELMTEYEYSIIKEIAFHIVEPNTLHKGLQALGKPVDKLISIAYNNKYFNKLIGSIPHLVYESLSKIIILANKISNDESIISKYKKRKILVSNIKDIKGICLEQIDEVAESFNTPAAVWLATEGALLAATTSLCEGIPYAQLIIPTLIATDISTSITLLFMNVCQIATSYGFSSKVSTNYSHIIAAITPLTDSADEGFLPTKTMANIAVHETAQFLNKNAGKLINPQNMVDDVLRKEAPQFFKLIMAVAERLGITITEKELGIIVPVAGILINGGINVAYQQVGHASAKDYFRLLFLSEKYGEEKIDIILRDEIRLLKNPIYCTKKNPT